jgi:hypothetical protein
MAMHQLGEQTETKEGIIKRNAKNDQYYNGEIDNIIYQTGEEGGKKK